MEFALNFPVNVQKLPKNGLRLTFTATAKERETMANNHDLLEVKNFAASYNLSKEKTGLIRLTGQFNAIIVQHCVATLQELTQIINENIDLRFINEDSKLAPPINSSEICVKNASINEFTETYRGNFINVGHITEEFFELAINRYPHSQDIEPIVFSTDIVIDSARENNCSPFFVLKQHRYKKGA